MTEIEIDRGNAYPNNIHPIRIEVMFVSSADADPVDPAVEERVLCRRYEAGMCRECEKRRGYMTAYCFDHYPFSKVLWSDPDIDW